MSFRYLLLLVTFSFAFHSSNSSSDGSNCFEVKDFLSQKFETSNEKVLKGKVLFDKNCAMCHGAKGKGDGSAGIYLVPRPFDITTEKVQSQSDSTLFKKITIGKAPMPSFGKLTPEDRTNLVLYIRELAKNNLKQPLQNVPKK